MPTKLFTNCTLKRRFLMVGLSLIVAQGLKAQSNYRPYEFFSYLRLDSVSYHRDTYYHSSLKPYFYDDSLFRVVNYKLDSSISKKSWVGRKLFDEHLVDVRKKEYSFYLDFLPDFQIGRAFNSSETIWQNTRGYQVGGTIGKKFSFYTSGYENQARFVDYIDDYVNIHEVVPGQSYNRGYDKDPVPATKDWSYVTALISYTPNSHLNVTLGHDKNFIGDGYRSLLLSDFASPYSFLKLTGSLGRVQYTVMWTSMQDPSAIKIEGQTKNRRKGAVFHYLDWNVNKRLSIGFFDAVVWAARDDQGNSLGFNIDYVNPIIFLRPLEASGGSSENAVLGFNAKYELASYASFYGQFVLDEFEAEHFFSGDGSYRNKYGFQLGFRGYARLKNRNLNYLLEYNTAKPYTYSAQKLAILNYAHYNEPLAHPLGANFRELVALLGYQFQRFDFTGQINYAKYGYDQYGVNFGKDIFKRFDVNYKQLDNYVGQGLTTDLLFFQGRAAYILNPKTNLRLWLGGGVRLERNDALHRNSSWFNFGLTSSFRNIYRDF